MASTIACSQPGIVSAGTKTLLTKVIGKSAVKPNICTFSGSFATIPTSTDTHENASAKTSTSSERAEHMQPRRADAEAEEESDSEQ